MKTLSNMGQIGDSRRGRLEKLAPLADLKLGLRRDEVGFMLGSPQLCDEMVAAKWLKPVVDRHKLQLFDRGDVTKAWVRILNGEQPPRLARAKAGGRNKDGGEKTTFCARTRARTRTGFRV
jgi:hypothetical protein